MLLKAFCEKAQTDPLTHLTYGESESQGSYVLLCGHNKRSPDEAKTISGFDFLPLDYEVHEVITRAGNFPNKHSRKTIPE